MNDVPTAVERLAVSRERLRQILRVSSASQQRNPLALVVGAVVLGGLLAWVRPWRWVPKSVLLAGLLPQIVLQTVARVPPTLWLNMLASLAQQWRGQVASPLATRATVNRAPVSAAAAR